MDGSSGAGSKKKLSAFHFERISPAWKACQLRHSLLSLGLTMRMSPQKRRLPSHSHENRKAMGSFLGSATAIERESARSRCLGGGWKKGASCLGRRWKKSASSTLLSSAKIFFQRSAHAGQEKETQAQDICRLIGLEPFSPVPKKLVSW